MFSFIFEGKLGGILAPVGPLNQLFLAIQHRRDAEMQQIVLANEIDITSYGECGYGAIHVSCQYGNQIALEVLLSRGVSIDSLDTKGNSTLHYAAKYGNVDMARYLCENGCNVSIRNQMNQTAYDVAANYHVIRQYLLPLQMKADQKMQADAVKVNPNGGQYQMHNPNFYDNAAQFVAPPPIFGGAQFGPPGGFSSDPSTSIGAPPIFQQSYGPPPTTTPNPYPPNLNNPNTSSTNSNDGSSQSEPPIGGGPFVGSSSNSSFSSNANTRFIQPDGFHSSASDPALQVKYGHVKQSLNIAPPPTGLAPPSSLSSAPNEYSLFGSSQKGTMNRPLYPGIPYAAPTYSNTPSQFSNSRGGLPTFYDQNPAQNQYQSTSNPSVFSSGYAAPPISQPFNTRVPGSDPSSDQAQYQHQQQQQYQHASAPPISLPHPHLQPPSHAAHSSLPGGGSGNLTSLNDPPVLQQLQQQQQNQPPPTTIIFNPAADTFVSANSSSNSVL